MTVSEKLRLVYGLHYHAETFGFNWDDGSDWTWHDVACKIADEVDAESAKLRELCKDMMAFVEDDNACERCGHDAECVEAADGELVLPYEGRCLMLDLFADRMRKLGVDVP